MLAVRAGFFEGWAGLVILMLKMSARSTEKLKQIAQIKCFARSIAFFLSFIRQISFRKIYFVALVEWQ